VHFGVVLGRHHVQVQVRWLGSTITIGELSWFEAQSCSGVS
jgi:hypothetical protein